MATASSDNQSGNEAEAKLLDSALQLFSKKGYEGTSIREIIEGAGVTRPVLYYYFENKEDLFTRLVEAKFAELVASIEEAKNENDTCAERLKKIMCIEFDLAEHNAEALRLILQVFFAPPQQGPELDRVKLAKMRFRHIEEIMQEGLDKGEIAGGDAQSLGLVFQGIMDMHVMAKSNRPAETHLSEDLAHGLVDLFFSGVDIKNETKASLHSPYSL